MRKGLIVSLLLHALAIAPLLFFLAPPTAPPSSQASPRTRFVAQTVNIETLQSETPPPIQPAAVPPPQAPEPLVSQSKSAVAVAPIQPETIEPSEPEPPPEPEPVREVEPLPPAEPAPVVEPETVEPEPLTEPVAAVEPEPVEPPAPARAPEPIPEPPPPEVIAREQPPVIEPRPPTEEERVANIPQPSALGASSPDQQAASTADPGAAPSQDYLSQISALLEENKQYPPMAQRYGMEGSVLLWFVLDRQGHVLDYRIDQSSGNAMLDQEVERLIEEISQFPPVPPDVGADTLELVVPVSFRLAG